MRSLLAAMVFAVAAGPAPAYAQPARPPATLPSPSPVRSPGPIGPSGIQAHAAVVIEVRTGAVLYERSGHDRLPPASLTKMATALVALERGALDQSIVGSERTQSEPRTIGMEPGDTLPLREAL